MIIQTLPAAPGDVIVITAPQPLTQAQRDALEARIVALVADTGVLILDGGMQMTVLKLPSAEVEQPLNVARDPLAREVQHIDTPDEEPTGLPPHVWLYRNMLTDLQAVAPLGRDETNGQYAVAVDQLTDEQRAIPHVYRQLQMRSDGHGVEARTAYPHNYVAEADFDSKPLQPGD
jgi:hypothetical protein